MYIYICLYICARRCSDIYIYIFSYFEGKSDFQEKFFFSVLNANVANNRI